MESKETLREALLAARTTIDTLRTENAHAKLLLDTLETLLVADFDHDPFAEIFTSLRSVFSFTGVKVLAADESAPDSLICVAADPSELIGMRWPVGTFFARVLNGRVTAALTNEKFEEWQALDSRLLSADQPVLYLPMAVRDRRGLLMLLRDVGDEGFDRSHVALARKFSVLASAAFAALHSRQREEESQRLRQLTTKLRESERALAYRANYDELTGLPNRTMIEERVTTAIRSLPPKGHLALAFIDLDNFKRVNDFYNHSVGDGLLVAVTERIKASIRSSDVLARLGGDEFVLLITPTEQVDHIKRAVERITEQLKLPFMIEGNELFTSASIGVSIFPDHGTDYDALRRNADVAMYRSKKRASGGIAYFDATADDTSATQMQQEQRLRAAVREQRFRCAFQPKIDIRKRALVGFEALIRWIDEKGLVRPPGHFIGMASDLGLLDDITGFVLREAVAALGQFDPVFGGRTRISINIAAKQASNQAFMESFIDGIAATGHAERLMLEITEEAMIQPDPFQSEILPALRQKGISVSIDDFGTGYSSFSVLADITADELKVDRSFISAIHQRSRSQSILKAVESLGSALGLPIVAEGVETADELNFLFRETGISMVQGYHIARPMFPKDLIDHWRAHHHRLDRDLSVLSAA
ncbi:MAG: GGDEF-domain containing protein [Rhodospirillaceae bacterium]|nr:GGDEF-domain containing protein [Rhodospirillaceae bacterium]